MTDKELERYIERELEDRPFEDILEEFDLTASEVFIILFKQGLINEEFIYV